MAGSTVLVVDDEPRIVEFGLFKRFSPRTCPPRAHRFHSVTYSAASGASGTSCNLCFRTSSR
jgi:hypothetical protein